MSQTQTSYRHIMKATSLFGGVQIFKILIQIIRSKFVALLLGPQGMGIMGLIASSIGLITSLSNFGLSVSAVKDISRASSTGDVQRVSIIVSVFRRLVWITGILGALITFTFSSFLSELAFGSDEFRFSFMWVSITLLLAQLSKGQLVVLQGMRKLKYLAKANLYGTALSLLVTIPLYYKYDVDGIVPGMIGSSIITLLFSYFYSRKISINSASLSWKEYKKEGTGMLLMGFMISLSGIFTVVGSYIVRLYVSNIGGISEVGLYNAGFAMINTYVGLIFTAMGTDYYPRLSAVADDNIECIRTVNQQSEIAILVLAPILIVFISFVAWIILILYSNKFLGIEGMVHWAALGMFFKSASWAIGYIFLAKSASKIFVISELLANIYILILNLIGYKVWGLTGLGISFFVSYLFIFIQVFLISKIKYKFKYEKVFLLIFLIQLCLAGIAMISSTVTPLPLSYLIKVIIIVSSIVFSYVELNKRLDLSSLLSRTFNKGS
jgi:O-antigen/teichoic acid export membrane protein